MALHSSAVNGFTSSVKRSRAAVRRASNAADSRRNPGTRPRITKETAAGSAARTMEVPDMSKLEGKVAIVTGGSKGIGASIAKHLAAEGAAVVVNYASSRDAADRVVAEITNNGGKAVAVRGDIAKQADIDHLFAAAHQAFGRLDILVNSAGVYEFRPLEEVTEEPFPKHFDLNVRGLILASKAAVKYLKSGGAIVNLSSVVSTATPPESVVYSATKAAVDAVTRALAKELGPRNIRVNAINPGMVETEGLHAAGLSESEFRKQYEAQTPLGRIGQPRDVAPAAVFLASDDSRRITGQPLRIAGWFR